MRILLVHPPIYDFTAADFWMRPYGVLRVAGRFRRQAEFQLFDFLEPRDCDAWGRGRFEETVTEKPAPLRDIPRRFRRFGKSRDEFREFLRREGPFDAVWIQTGMSYWFLGVREAIETLRAEQPQARIALGGVYATLCPEHARTLGADLVCEGLDLAPLARTFGLSLEEGPPLWELVSATRAAGAIKITEGCPFRCSYCSVPQVYPPFQARPLHACLEELRALANRGIENVAFYDDALLHRSKEILAPLLEQVLAEGLRLQFHTPNALNARFLDPALARLMVRAGFRSFFLGFESGSYEWQRKTGGKVYAKEFETAVHALREAGAQEITAYVIVGHPDHDEQAVEESIRFAAACGARVMLSEFAPIPGTPDGERCRPWADLSEPLHHNKTAFAIRRLGFERLQSLKDLARACNGAPFHFAGIRLVAKSIK